MKFRKTPITERDSYTYCFADGTKSTVVPGEDGVTQMTVKVLYSLEDSEVYYNIKNSRPQLTDKEKAEVKEWEEKNPGEEVLKNWNLSIESLLDEGIDLDKTGVFADSTYHPFEEVPDEIARLREVVAMLTPDQQEIYQRVFIEGESPLEVAEDMGIPSKQAMNNRLNKIKAQIKKLF